MRFMITQRMLNGSSSKSIINKITNYNGFNLIRYADSYGTIIEYNWPTSSGGLGERRAMEVIDAAYRFKAAYAADDYGVAVGSNYKYDMPNLTNFASSGSDGKWELYNKKDYSYTTAISSAFTNTLCCSQWRNLSTDKTAKYNTNQWMSESKYNGSDYAPYKTRHITVDSVNGKWDIPNEFQLIVIFCCSDKLDEMDPTFSSNKAKGLGYTATDGRFSINSSKRIWSSTEISDENIRCVTQGGFCGSSYKYSVAGVVPIRELTI